jgi:hypothetical protein
MISGTFFGNRFEWQFTNVFTGYQNSNGDVLIDSSSLIIPDVWAHHCLSYDDTTGLLEYWINGKTEAVVWVTNTGTENGIVNQAVLGVPAEMEICPLYTGLVDDFRILRDFFVPAYCYDTFRSDGGRFETMPLEMSATAAELTGISASVTLPSETAVQFFARAGDNFYSWTDTFPEWVPVISGEQISGIRGRFFQIAGELYPDGTGSRSPSITQLSLSYREESPPLPPFTVSATAGDGMVTVSWTASASSDTAGYYVYYGGRPGEYLGTNAIEGSSPIDVNNNQSLQLTGLKNGKIYYFAVAAYSSGEHQFTGDLSVETSARPLRKKQ